MLEEKDIKAINGIYTDFKSSVIVAGLVEQGFDPDRILCVRNGAVIELERKSQPDGKSERKVQGMYGSGKEIVSIENADRRKSADYPSDPVLLISTNRESIYDRLPEGLFHALSVPRAKSGEAMKREMQRGLQQEKYLRKFFPVFEAEIDRMRSEIALEELKFDKPERYRDLVDILRPYWSAIQFMDLPTALLFVRMIPNIASIRNRYDNIAWAISTVMGCTVTIVREACRRRVAMKFPRLSDMKLGVNAVLCGQLYDTRPQTGITINPPAAQIKDYLPGGEKRRIVEALCEIFMPAMDDVVLSVKAKQEDYTSKLSDQANPCFLGVNARLKSNRNES